MNDNLFLWCRRKVGREEKTQLSFTSCSEERLECKNTVPQEDPEIIVCFLVASCTNDKLCCSFANIHIVHSHGHPVGDVFSADVLPSISSCAALMATLMGKCLKILHSRVDLNCRYIYFF